MNTIDIVIATLLLWSAYNGFRHGLIKELVSSAGFFVGLFIAYHTYNKFGAYLAPALNLDAGWSPYVVKVLAFVLIWIIVPVLLGVAANLITRSFKALHLGWLNGVAGAIVCMAKYAILMSFVFCAMNYLGILNANNKKDSKLYAPIASLASFVFDGVQLDLPHRNGGDGAERDSTIWIDIHH